MTKAEKIEIIVEEGSESDRIDVYLASHPEIQFTRSKIQNLISEQAIFVNGQEANKKQKVKPFDTIQITVEPEEEILLEPENIPLDIVYNDEHLAVINKQAGLVTHPGAGNKKGTLVNALLFHFQQLSQSTDADRPGIVHRLDKDTSGLLLIAKNDKVHKKLQEAIQTREVKRTYLALICGHIQDDMGEINLPIGRSINNRKKMTVTNVGSRDAITEYALKARYRTYDLMEVNLQTGRTHQIRVHFSHLGHPVFGDPEYGGRDKWHKGIFGPERPLAKRLLGIMKRQALHAQKLAFTHPVSGDFIELEAKIPDDYQKVIKILDNEGS